VAPAGKAVPGSPRPGLTATGWSRGIWVLIRGTPWGGGKKLGLFRLAWATLILFTGWGDGKGRPWTKAGGMILLM
jgi:hypothetical protein